MLIQRVLKHGIRRLYIFSRNFRLKFLKNAIIRGGRNILMFQRETLPPSSGT
jgi:hypothetical protein